MRESEVERYFVKRVKETGGLQRKFVSPGHRGVPDRVFIAPGGFVYFIEFKAPGQKLRADQVREHEKMYRVGANVVVIDSKEAVDCFIPPKRKL